jgi:hypothetical protein
MVEQMNIARRAKLGETIQGKYSTAMEQLRSCKEMFVIVSSER